MRAVAGRFRAGRLQSGKRDQRGDHVSGGKSERKTRFGGKLDGGGHGNDERRTDPRRDGGCKRRRSAESGDVSHYIFCGKVFCRTHRARLRHADSVLCRRADGGRAVFHDELYRSGRRARICFRRHGERLFRNDAGCRNGSSRIHGRGGPLFRDLENAGRGGECAFRQRHGHARRGKIPHGAGCDVRSVAGICGDRCGYKGGRTRFSLRRGNQDQPEILRENGGRFSPFGCLSFKRRDGGAAASDRDGVRLCRVHGQRDGCAARSAEKRFADERIPVFAGGTHPHRTSRPSLRRVSESGHRIFLQYPSVCTHVGRL